MRKIFALLASFFILSASAIAADVVPAADHDWTGFYFGGVAAYGWADSKHCDGMPCFPNGPRVSSDGVAGGLDAGFNYQFQQIVVGIEGDYMFSDINGSHGSTASYGCGGGPGCVTDVDGIGTMRARLGLAMDRWLPFVTGGLAISDVKATIGPYGGGHDTYYNFTAGAGVEYAFSDHFSAKLEYLHIFDNGHRFIFKPTLCVAPGCSIDNYSADLLRVGLNYKF